ncbi:MAG: AMP-binding protein [Actinomycetota bacterium]
MRAELAAAVRLGALDPVLNGARALGVAQWGPGIAASVTAAAVRHPRRVAIIDDDRETDYRSLDCRATSLAAHLRRRAAGGSVGILARNHAGFLIAQVAAERAGVDLLLLSTALPAPNLREVVEREEISVLVADVEFEELLGDAALDSPVIWADGPRSDDDSLWSISSARRLCSPPSRRSRLVLLTSGTTGPPKGARRTNRAPRISEFGLLTRIPYKTSETYYVAPPLFHAWGLSQATMALATASTLILRRRFNAAATIELLAEREVDVLAVVPLMLRRILQDDAGHLTINRPRLVLSSGNVLSGSLATEWMDANGDHLYNIYGSTEAALGTVADPVDLRAAPGTVGRPPRGVTLSILDGKGMPVTRGRSGRVFLSSAMQFSGYTDGSDGDRSGTMLATGDMGWVDDDGRLHVRGRANDMIVTGGENVYPSRVEEIIDRLPEVELTAVVGVDDDEYGQRVVAFVVPRKGWTVDTDRVRDATAIELPNFMIPREVFVVDALPMTTTGKVIRHRLAVLGDRDRV